jgi:hypothetical protein
VPVSNQQRKRRGDAETEISQDEGDESRRHQRQLPKALHQPADEAALQDDSEKADVAEYVANLARSERVPLIRKAAFAKSANPEMNSENEVMKKEELQQPLPKTGASEILRVGPPVERRFAISKACCD